MEQVLKRFLDYVTINTGSTESSGDRPSSPGQWVLARKLAAELAELGAQRIRLSDHCCLFAELPATPGCENAPALGLIAHLDTSDSAPGGPVQPRLVVYDGGVIPLGDSGRTLDPERFPDLLRHRGEQLVVTDGNTLLGADDKAGIAEIMTALSRLIAGERSHGRLCVGFTPDEEIGEGTRFFDVEEFGADFAYTVDGGAAGEIEFQNFNAAQAIFEIRGVSVHPGSARGTMVNALKVAMELDALLPQNEVPEHTAGFEGFYHLISLTGGVGSATAVYLLRDHDAAAFAGRIAVVERAAGSLNDRYGAGTVTLHVKQQYRNMKEIIDRYPFLIEVAEEAARQAGLTPEKPPIRGGTDGAMLSFLGLPCPNLGTGGYNFHGEQEYASVPELVATVEWLLHLIAAFSRLRKSQFNR